MSLRVNWATVGDAGVVGEVGYVPFGRDGNAPGGSLSHVTTRVSRKTRVPLACHIPKGVFPKM